jgi:hypothetical protein
VATVDNNKCFVFNIFHRYASHFHCKTEAKIRKRKEAAQKCINTVSAPKLEIAVEGFFLKELDFPKGPSGTSDKLKLQKAEKQEYFMLSIMFNFDL